MSLSVVPIAPPFLVALPRRVRLGQRRDSRLVVLLRREFDIVDRKICRVVAVAGVPEQQESGKPASGLCKCLAICAEFLTWFYLLKKHVASTR